MMEGRDVVGANPIHLFAPPFSIALARHKSLRIGICWLEMPGERSSEPPAGPLLAL